MLIALIALINKDNSYHTRFLDLYSYITLLINLVKFKVTGPFFTTMPLKFQRIEDKLKKNSGVDF